MKLWQKNISSLEEVERFTVGNDRHFDAMMARHDVLGNMAHAIMLSEIGLLTEAEKDQLLAELKRIHETVRSGSFKIADGVEDVHSQVEFLLTAALGDTGKKIHSARSRNDQVLVDIKLFLRAEIIKLTESIQSFFNLLQAKSEAHQTDLLPGYTHLQLAMPSSFGLWFGAYAESLVDDMIMLNAAYKVVNKAHNGQYEIEKHIYDVADKFKRQLNTQLIQQSLPEENVELQERVKKACHYFINELNKVVTELEKVNFDADNKSVKKAITEAQENLNKQLFIKDNALKLCVNGFEVLAYLKTKANAEIDFSNIKKETTTKTTPAKAPKGTENEDLYLELKAWRDNLAAENGGPVYQILPQKTLAELVKALPTNFEELESIKGIGKIKVKMYGNEILTIIADYCERMEISRTPFQQLIKTNSKPKIDTKEISFSLFKTGKSIPEIAAERGFTTSTIESHLIHYIENGQMDVKDFVTQHYIDLIEDYLIQNPTTGLNDAKAALPEEITFNEIRAVMKSLILRNNMG